jgi:hypothetical protein
MTQVGTTVPSAPGAMALITVHLDPWPPVLKPQRPLTRRPPLTGTPVPVGENTPLMRGSPPAKISSWASSGKTPASQDIALMMVATQDVDGQPRASWASTSHCV